MNAVNPNNGNETKQTFFHGTYPKNQKNHKH